MNKSWVLKTEITWLFGITILAIILRFWQLGFIPTGITHDEMGYIYNAYSIAITGKNVFGETFPLFTWMTRGGFPFMPVPIYSMVPLFWVLPLTPTVARLLPGIMGVLDILLLFYICRILFTRSRLALVSALFFAISPWHLHFTRSAYDANFALFYYLAATAAFLWALHRKKTPWISVVCTIAAIFSYRGMSILFLPIMLAHVWYAYTAHNIAIRRQIPYLLGIAVCMLFLLAAMVINGPGYTAEGTQIINNPKMKADIDGQIREAQGPLFIRRIFANKPIYIIDRIRENYIKAYSPEFLFLYTEPSAIYSIWSRGRIYFIDVLFIILGCIYVFRLQKHSALLWIGFLLIGGLPGGIGGMPYSSRNFFLSSVYPVFSAAGVLFVLSATKIKSAKYILLACIVFLYTYALGSYLYDYYGRYALYGAEGWAKSIKDISRLANEKKDTHAMVFLGKTSYGDVVEYAFWNRIHPDTLQKAWKNQQSEPFRYFPVDTILFSEKCLDSKDLKNPLLQNTPSIYYITHHTCNNEATPSGKILDYQGNTLWKLFEIDQPNSTDLSL